jgi:aromatic ring hydroxylase
MLRTGKDYLAAIQDGRMIYIGSELVRDVTATLPVAGQT